MPRLISLQTSKRFIIPKNHIYYGKENGVNTQSNFINLIFKLFCIYLVLPLYDVPLLGLSLSAPMMLIIAIPSFLKPPKPWFKTYQLWIFLPILIWLSIAISTTFNGILSLGLKVNLRSFISVIQYMYWSIVFILTVYMASSGENLKTISELLGWAIGVLAIIRLGEVVLTGNYINYGTARLLPANAYGMLFSMFSPFLYIMIFKNKGLKRFLALLGTFLLMTAVLVNGSRGSWISIGLGLSFTLLILFFSKPSKFSGLVITLIVLSSGLFLIGSLVPSIENSVKQRFDTLSNLDEDKSALIREVMIQKGIRLFKENWLIGIGSERFKQETIELDLPARISYISQSEFNTNSSHNSYIQFLAEFGLAGIIPFGLLLLLLLIRGFKASLLAVKVGEITALAIFVSFIQMSTHMWVISSLTNTTTWLIYGLVAAMIMREQYKGSVCV